MYADKLPPHDINAEEAALGSVLIDDARWSDVAAVLTSPMFYREQHRVIYDAMAALTKANRAVDQITLAHQLDAKLEGVGGPAYLAHLINAVDTPLHARHYAGIVYRHYQQRETIRLASELANKGYSGDDWTPTMQSLLNLQSRSDVGGPKSAVALSDMYMDEVTDWIHGDSPGGLKTGYIDLDRKLGGMVAGQVYVVAGITGGGKTRFAQGVTLNVAREGTPVLYASLEMAELSLIQRWLAIMAGVEPKRITMSMTTDSERAALMDAWEEFQGLPIYIDDTTSLSVPEIQARVHQIKEVGMVVVDYLALVKSSGRGSAYEKMTEKATDVANMARSLNVPVLELAQINRSPSDRAVKRPTITDLKDSGQVENDAGAVMLLYYHPKYVTSYYMDEKPELENVLEVLVGKNRFGDEGAVSLFYDDSTGRIGNLKR